LQRNEGEAMPVGDYAVGNADVSGLDSTIARQLDQFIAASPGISIYSAYRSPQKQAGLWNAALQKYGGPEAARKWVAPPGRSYHNRGMAADLRYSTPEALTWAQKNAADYGLKFPLANENWHIEPVSTRGNTPQVAVGPPAATGGADGGSLSLPSSGVPGTAVSALFSDSRAPGASLVQPEQRAGGPLFTADHMTTDAFLSDYMNGINPLRTLFFGKLRSLLA
jgi:hypothetical protein